MKRYILFCFPYYYPSGGADDLVGVYNTIEECDNAMLGECFWGCYQVYDKQTDKIVKEINRED